MEIIDLRGATKYVSEKLGKNIVVAEIGVRKGRNAIYMIDLLKPKQLYLIDSFLAYQDGPVWMSQKEQNEIKEFMMSSLRFYKPKVFYNFKLSVDASKDYAENYFDYIYIDSNHSYNSVKEDIEIWYPKVRAGGYIGGHDYKEGDEVFSAVNDFVKSKELKLIYLPPIGYNVDWLVQKK